MVRKNNLYPIKTIKDWQGEDWDVYEEIKTVIGIMLYRGRLYSLKTGGQFAYILTHELAEYIKVTGLYQASEQLGISDATVGRFRQELQIQRKLGSVASQHDWMMAHLDELFSDSYYVLEQKYGLPQLEVERYCRYLLHRGIVRNCEVRGRKQSYDKEQWYQTHKDRIAHMSLNEIQQTFNISRSVAGGAYRRVCREKQQPTLKQLKEQQWEENRQWMLEHQADILNTNISIKEIAEKLNRKEKQIIHLRTKLRKILNITPPMPGVDWVRTHQTDLEQLSHVELQQKYQKTQGQIEYSLRLLEMLQQKETQSVA